LSIRSILDRGFMIYGFVYLDALLKGILANRVYDVSTGGVWSMVVMLLLGLLFTRSGDPEKPILQPKRRRGKRTYHGPPPLFDLHFYARDLLYPLTVCAFLFSHTLVASFIENKDLVGRWEIGDGSGESFSLRTDGSVRCEGQTSGRRAGWFHVSGNLLDGFRLLVGPDPDKTLLPCGRLTLFPDEGRRFWMKNDTLVFDDPGFPVWRRISRTEEPKG
jgi:hypothetical protein